VPPPRFPHPATMAFAAPHLSFVNMRVVLQIKLG
jgi:hypothetical protein